MLIPVTLGVLAGGAALALARALAPPRETWLYALGLAGAAAVYVIFALVAGAGAWAAVELAGLVLFGLLAMLGLRAWPGLLAAGWALHAGWDVALHGLLSPGIAPAGYPELCLGFDVALAVGIALRVRAGALAPLAPRRAAA